MTFLQQFEADVRKATKDHQRALVVEVLRGRAGELTLGDIRKLLQSTLGKGLDDVQVASLFGAHAGNRPTVVVWVGSPDLRSDVR